MGQGNVASLDWKTWGQDQILEIQPGASESPFEQLITINHPHPEAWRFLLSAEWLTPPGIFGLTVQFSLVAGNGLTRFSLQSPPNNISDNESFAFFRWNTNTNPKRWTTRVKVPDVNDFFVPGTIGYSPSFCEVIVGQTIVVAAKAFYGAPAPAPDGMKVRVGASFAPNVFGQMRERPKNERRWQPDIEDEGTSY